MFSFPCLTDICRFLKPESDRQLAQCCGSRVFSGRPPLLCRPSGLEDARPLPEYLPYFGGWLDTGGCRVHNGGPVIPGAKRLQMSFIIPLGAKPSQCHNSVTPNNTASDLTCGFSGAILAVGGLASIMWGEY